MTGGGTSLSDEVSVADVPRTIVATFSLSNDRVSVSTPNGPRGISVYSHVVLWKISFSILVMTQAVPDIVLISRRHMRITII